MWAERPEFGNIINEVWQSQILEFSMYNIVQKLKVMKGKMKALNKQHFSSISDRVNKSKQDLLDIQIKLSTKPSYSDLRLLEKQSLFKLESLRKDEESFFAQKSRISWLSVGHQINLYFHNAVKNRTNRNKIISLTSEDGSRIVGHQNIKEKAVTYFQNLLDPSNSPYHPGFLC